MTEIKICGLSRQCDIEESNALPIQYIGFIFASKSHRYVTPEKAQMLKKSLRSSIKAVGVFVNEPPLNVAALLNEGTIDIAQLHGSEDEAYIAKLRILTDKPIWKAYRIDTHEDVLQAASSKADLILLDAGSGGTGKAFDWSLIGEINRPYILAGGLNTANIADAVCALRPHGIDVSSGVETDKLKDAEKMKKFVQIIRDLDRNEDSKK